MKIGDLVVLNRIQEGKPNNIILVTTVNDDELKGVYLSKNNALHSEYGLVEDAYTVEEYAIKVTLGGNRIRFEKDPRLLISPRAKRRGWNWKTANFITIKPEYVGLVNHLRAEKDEVKAEEAAELYTKYRNACRQILHLTTAREKAKKDLDDMKERELVWKREVKDSSDECGKALISMTAQRDKLKKEVDKLKISLKKEGGLMNSTAKEWEKTLRGVERERDQLSVRFEASNKKLVSFKEELSTQREKIKQDGMLLTEVRKERDRLRKNLKRMTERKLVLEKEKRVLYDKVKWAERAKKKESEEGQPAESLKSMALKFSKCNERLQSAEIAKEEAESDLQRKNKELVEIGQELQSLQQAGVQTLKALEFQNDKILAMVDGLWSV